MSSKAKPYIVGAALGASTMFFALQYHVIHSNNGLQIVPRTPQQSPGLAYVDIRNWTPSQWTDRPELARALMAHGSSDLIAESVASSLAETVSEDGHGLDELRSFLNETRTTLEERADQLLRNPDVEDFDDTTQSPRSGKSGGSEVVGIPFPQDANTRPPADPFRSPSDDHEETVPGTMANTARGTDIASRSEVPAKSTTKPNGGSRFSADDVIDGFDGPAAPSATNSSSARRVGPTSNSKSVLEQGRRAADLLFGEDHAPAGGNAPGKDSSMKQEKKANAPASEADSMFEEVTSQLENRAQDALNRAQEAARTRVTSAVDEAAASDSSFVRKPEDEKSQGAAVNSPSDAESNPAGHAPDQFDPFLE
ncbi:MAG: hypothetical protein ACK58L_01070 [Planctomycetota bacterium]